MPEVTGGSWFPSALSRLSSLLRRCLPPQIYLRPDLHGPCRPHRLPHILKQRFHAGTSRSGDLISSPSRAFPEVLSPADDADAAPTIHQPRTSRWIVAFPAPCSRFADMLYHFRSNQFQLQYKHFHFAHQLNTVKYSSAQSSFWHAFLCRCGGARRKVSASSTTEAEPISCLLKKLKLLPRSACCSKRSLLVFVLEAIASSRRTMIQVCIATSSSGFGWSLAAPLHRMDFSTLTNVAS